MISNNVQSLNCLLPVCVLLLHSNAKSITKKQYPEEEGKKLSGQRNKTDTDFLLGTLPHPQKTL